MNKVTGIQRRLRRLIKFHQWEARPSRPEPIVLLTNMRIISKIIAMVLAIILAGDPAVDSGTKIPILGHRVKEQLWKPDVTIGRCFLRA